MSEYYLFPDKTKHNFKKNGMQKRFEKPRCGECKVRFLNYFNMLSPEDLLELSVEKTSILYSKGQNIYYEGSYPNGLYCLNSGRVKIFRNGTDGREQIVRVVSPGDVFGIKSLIEGKKYSTTACAIEDSVVCFINNRRMFHLFMKYPNLTNQLLVKLSRMLEEAEQKMTSIALKSVKERVAETLLHIYNTFFQAEPNGSRDIKISREDLASLVGSATETVIRVLSELKDENIIEIECRTIRILDLKTLTRIARVQE